MSNQTVDSYKDDLTRAKEIKSTVSIFHPFFYMTSEIELNYHREIKEIDKSTQSKPAIQIRLMSHDSMG